VNRDIGIALVCGVLFGLGLAVSQMINPAKVLAFLDVAGAWDPSLALVMASAVSIMAVAWRLPARGPHASPATPRPGWRDVDARLVTGAVLFGVGWGLVGYCPGPAIAALGLLGPKPAVFVLAMLGGMALHHGWSVWKAYGPGETPA
jgi:uncharacterized protein